MVKLVERNKGTLGAISSWFRGPWPEMKAPTLAGGSDRAIVALHARCSA